ncbi:substrate-binding periplasmic protein [Vibrio sp. TBV020]|uniref:substrate-binding periplasmic protein n=1 Tax=Vibrio sp. TBV020 TaxID=3137398 RepID=UPI0038CD1290
MNKILTYLFISVAAYTFPLNAQTLEVGLIDHDRYPYFYADATNGNLTGLYIDILNFVSVESGIEFHYQRLPQKRLREYMKGGLIDVEPGIDMDWRQHPKEINNSVYTDVLFKSEEVIVYNRDVFSKDATVEEIMATDSCSVIGFNPPADPQKHPTIELYSEPQILELLKRKRCSWAQIPLYVLKSDYRGRVLVHTKPIIHYLLRIRLVKSQQHTLPSLNRAIEKLHASGRLEDLIYFYTGGE